MSKAHARRWLWMVIGALGFVLSPLSWWNDLYVNIPLSYLVASLVSHDDSQLFIFVMTGTYWITNVLGLLLMHLGVKSSVLDRPATMNRREIVKSILLSVVYTVVVVLLALLGVIRPIQEYLSAL